MAATREEILGALEQVIDPELGRSVIELDMVRDIAIEGPRVGVTIALTVAGCPLRASFQEQVDRALLPLDGVDEVALTFDVMTADEKAALTTRLRGGVSERTPGISVDARTRVLAVASGKGGVGKSTCSVNLACALTHLGARVGLLDCDIYGPSIPLMMGVRGRPTISPQEKMVPPSNYGVKLMSMGFLIEGDQPVIWRGPMITKTIQQFFHSVEWGDLDCLLVDLPPGTGDAQLSLCQTVPLDGGVIVTTPQEASLGVVRKGIAMFGKVNVPILGLIENMSYFTAPGGQRVEIFGHGGGRAEAERQGVTFLGEVPIYTEIRIGGDEGRPVVVSASADPPGQAFLKIAEALRSKLG